MVELIRVGVMCHKGFDGYPGPDSIAGIQTGCESEREGRSVELILKC